MGVRGPYHAAMPHFEKKRVANTAEEGDALVQLINLPDQLSWADIWTRTKVMEFTDPDQKNGKWIVQLGYILKDQFGRVGVYERAARQVGEQRFSAGFSVLSGASLLSWDMLSSHESTFEQEYPDRSGILPVADLIGGYRPSCLGVGFSIAKRTRNGKESLRRFIFVVFHVDVHVRDRNAGAAPASPVSRSPEEDEFLGFMSASDAIDLLSAQQDELMMDLAVLDAIKDGARPAPGAETRRESTVFRVGAPNGSARPLLVRLRAWRDRHPWIIAVLWVCTVVLPFVLDIRELLGLD